jgi:hypothetical protein
MRQQALFVILSSHKGHSWVWIMLNCKKDWANSFYHYSYFFRVIHDWLQESYYFLSLCNGSLLGIGGHCTKPHESILTLVLIYFDVATKAQIGNDNFVLNSSVSNIQLNCHTKQKLKHGKIYCDIKKT